MQPCNRARCRPQTPEGVRVPEVLVPFMGGITFLPFTRAKPENLTQAKMDRAAARKANKKAGGKKAGGKQAGGKKAGGKKAGGKKTGAGGAGAGAGAAAPATAAVATAAAPAPQSAAPPAPQTSESRYAAAGVRGRQDGKASPAEVGAALTSPAGLAALNQQLIDLPFLGGFAGPNKRDAEVAAAIDQLTMCVAPLRDGCGCGGA